MTRVSEDIPNAPVCDLVKTLYESFEHIVFVSGRNGTKQCYADSREWIINNLNFNPDDVELYMRKENDSRADYIIKEEIYRNELMPKYFIKYVVDDRLQVVKAVREMGLPVFQVAEGNF